MSTFGKELAFDRIARVLYIPGYAIKALALMADGMGDMEYVASLHFLLKPGTIRKPSDAEIAEHQKSGVIPPGSGDTLWLLGVREAYAELEKALIP